MFDHAIFSVVIFQVNPLLFCYIMERHLVYSAWHPSKQKASSFKFQQHLRTKHKANKKFGKVKELPSLFKTLFFNF